MSRNDKQPTNNANQYFYYCCYFRFYCFWCCYFYDKYYDNDDALLPGTTTWTTAYVQTCHLHCHSYSSYLYPCSVLLAAGLFSFYCRLPPTLFSQCWRHCCYCRSLVLKLLLLGLICLSGCNRYEHFCFYKYFLHKLNACGTLLLVLLVPPVLWLSLLSLLSSTTCIAVSATLFATVACAVTFYHFPGGTNATELLSL